MKVITVGRSHDNDVRIDDPYVGRHHCQIVQHDNGMFTIVDMNSTNGTYVNGRRVFGEIHLQPNDTVIIGHTNLTWMNYFPTVPLQSDSNSYVLPIVLGSVGGALLLALVLILTVFKFGSEKVFAFKGECPDAVAVNMVNEDGVPYTIDAIEGQVCVWFEEGTPYKTAMKSIKASGGRIVAQIPENGYYLVEVPADKVQVFLKRITKENYVDWAYPNLVYYPCLAKNYILDNFYPNKSKKNKDDTPHGVIVQFAMLQCDSGSPLDTFNIGTKNGKSMKTTLKWRVPMSSTDNLAFASSAIASSPDSGPIIINMSFGPYLRQRKDTVQYYWEEATIEEKKDYKERYLNSIRSIIENAKKLKGKDYIIVKSAGNNGVKKFDDEIISYLRDNLRPDELEIMDKHFIIVTAGEKERIERYSEIEKDFKKKYDEAVRKKDKKAIIDYDTNWRKAKVYVNFISTYSNEMESGHYNPWVTKVDISDFKFKGEDKFGTSFAAPYAAGILSSVANDMNLTGAEVLKLAREVTKRYGELTKDALLQAAKNEKNDSSKEVTIEGVLRMYLLNSSGGSDITYYTDAKGNVINAVGEEDLDNPYCQTIYEYRETDFDNTHLAFVVEVDNAINVTPYLEAGDDEFLDDSFQSAFMLVPQFQYNGKDFAKKYANKRIRATGTLYVPGGGWRNATAVVMSVRNIELLDNEEPIVSKRSHSSLVGTKWRSDFSHNPDIEWYDALQFDDETKGTALSVYEGESTVVTHFHYFYDEEYNGWYVTDWGKNIMYFVVSGNELNMGFYKPCIVNGKNCIFESRRYYKM